jgi:GNAT superfamily N-acetyltransferase
MADMLVRLYALPDLAPEMSALRQAGIEVRQAHPSERGAIVGWVRSRFSDNWAEACEVALTGLPARCFIAVEKDSTHQASPDPYDLSMEMLVGFACYDAVARGMLGPEGVHDQWRGRGIGKVLLLSCVHRMAAEGYAYAVVGWAGPTAFYERSVAATLIADSEPGIYRGKLKVDI